MQMKKDYTWKIIISVFIFITIFPTIRILLIGNEQSTNFTELIISVMPEILIGLLMLFSIYNLRHKKQDRSIRNLPFNIKFNYLDWAVLIYALSNIIYGMILSRNFILSAYAIRLSFFPILCYYIARFTLYDNKNQGYKIYTILNYWFCILAIFGLVLYFVFPDLMMFFIIKSGGTITKYIILRMTSILWTPVVFGYIMSIGAIYSYFRICTKNSLTDYIMFCIYWLCLFYTVSRGPIASFLIGFILVTIFYSPKWKKSVVTTFLIILIYMMNIFIIPQGKELSNWLFYSTLKTIELEDGLTRVELWNKSYQSFIEKPEGYGLGKAGLVAKRFFKDKNNKDVSIYSTDCMYLKVANETGVWGLFSFLSLSLLFFIKFYKYFTKNKKSFFSFLFILFIIAYLDSVFHNYMDLYFLSYFFWFTAGISVNYIAYDKN